jgi:hypothetical protein
MYQGKVGSKRYLRYSHRSWDWLLGNEVQYINRLTASEIVTILTNTDLVDDEVETDASGDADPDRFVPAIAAKATMISGQSGSWRRRSNRRGSSERRKLVPALVCQQ